MSRHQDWEDRQAADAAFAARVERLERFTGGLSAEECREVAERGHFVDGSKLVDERTGVKLD